MIEEFLSSRENLLYFYILIGFILFYYAYKTYMDPENQKKLGTGIYWVLLGILFVAGKWLPALASGIIVVVIALVAGAQMIGMGSYFETTEESRKEYREKLGNSLLIPIAAISGTAILFAILELSPLIGLSIGSIAAFLISKFYVTEDTVDHILDAGRELSDSIGWALILPPYLAALGALFEQAGVGQIIADGVLMVLPVDQLIWAIIAYALGMALFTMIMGNAFAAFAVITSGIGAPILIEMHGANIAYITALAMTAGYCGTLMTPMAANFNIVPVALLDMKDEYGVIKKQIPMAIALLATHIVLMYVLAF